MDMLITVKLSRVFKKFNEYETVRKIKIHI